jgi:SAM-dependent methyltransferase
MSNQFRYLLTYEQLVATLLRAHPEDEAMARIAVGDWERVGALQHALLRSLGIGPGSQVVEVGCGPGRLAGQLARHEGLQYLGVDIVPQVLDYARRKTGRPDFRFIHVDRIALPTPDESADVVVFFGVFPHILPEESYLYLEEARRVLKPGGRAVFTFHDFASPNAWRVFEKNLQWVRERALAATLNIFLHRDDLRIWAERLGFEVEALRAGQERCVVVDAAEATPVLPAGVHGFGQCLGIFAKPRPGQDEAGEERARAAARRRAARLRRERATDAAEADED